MKALQGAVLVLLAVIATPATSQPADETRAARKFSYILGLQTGNHLRKQLPQAIHDIDVDMMMKGIADAMHGRDPNMDVAEITFWSGKFLNILEERRKTSGAANAAAGEKFRGEYATREGVKTTASGMLYRELAAGEGRQPGIGQTVTVHYKGTHLDGREFDSSYQRGQPAQLSLRQVIPGWQEALTLMRPGAKWEIVLPPGLAYGNKGAGTISPNETLIFEVELLQVH
ncbi:MAG: hypothetical protein GKR94_08900 [Gammaproteobacteria bacterium]|nr:hypothetical protein [Gammaproteobacteria bacterium]